MTSAWYIIYILQCGAHYLLAVGVPVWNHFSVPDYSWPCQLRRESELSFNVIPDAFIHQTLGEIQSRYVNRGKPTPRSRCHSFHLWICQNESDVKPELCYNPWNEAAPLHKCEKVHISPYSRHLQGSGTRFCQSCIWSFLVYKTQLPHPIQHHPTHHLIIQFS